MADLSVIKDEELLSLARECEGNDKESAKYTSALISRYMQIIIIKANKLKGSRGCDREDLISEGFMGLLSAIRSFDVSKGNFNAFANTCINNKMKTQMRLSGRRKEVADGFDFNLLEDLAPRADELLIKRESDGEFLEKVRELLSDFEYNILTLYMSGYSYRHISGILGTNIKSVDNALSRVRMKLKNLKK